MTTRASATHFSQNQKRTIYNLETRVNVSHSRLITLLFTTKKVGMEGLSKRKPLQTPKNRNLGGGRLHIFEFFLLLKLHLLISKWKTLIATVIVST